MSMSVKLTIHALNKVVEILKVPTNASVSKDSPKMLMVTVLISTNVSIKMVVVQVSVSIWQEALSANVLEDFVRVMIKSPV